MFAIRRHCTVQRNVHLRVSTVTSLPIALKPQHRPRIWVSSHSSESQWNIDCKRCILCTEILSTFNAWVEYISVTKYMPLKQLGQWANDPKIHPFTLKHVDPIYYMNAWADPTHHPKWHPDPISHFSTVHFADRQTDRLTDRQTARQMVQANFP